MAMLPRERVMQAINFKKTDRAPANYSAHEGVTEGLIARLGVAGREELLQAFDVGLRRIPMDYGQGDTGPDADGYTRSMWGLKHLEGDPRDGLPHFIMPFDESSTVDDVHAHEWPDPEKIDVSGVKAECEKYVDTYVTCGAPWSPFFHEVGWLIGQENFYMWMCTKPDVMQAIIDHFVDYEVAVTRRYLEAAGGKLDIAYFGNDFGTQRGLFVSPEMWQRFFRKPLKRFFDAAHDFGCKVMKHSCGSVRDIIPSLIEDGLNVLDPIQVRAAGMDMPGLVRDFGGKLAFHGAVDTQQTLPFGTTDDVRAQVRGYRDLTREQGGYVLCGSQEFIEDIPLDNILAIYDENMK